MLTEERKTKLPPIYEPLYLNCDLLFGLANELQISENEQVRIEKILHGSSRDDSLFLNKSLNDKYYFEKKNSADSEDIELEKGVIRIPASMASDKTKITVKIGAGMSSVTADDWQVKKVERKKAGDISTFMVEYTSKKAEDAIYNDGEKIVIDINPVEGSECPSIKASFTTKKTKKLMLTSYEFERIDK